MPPMVRRIPSRPAKKKGTREPLESKSKSKTKII